MAAYVWANFLTCKIPHFSGLPLTNSPGPLQGINQCWSVAKELDSNSNCSPDNGNPSDWTHHPTVHWHICGLSQSLTGQSYKWLRDQDCSDIELPIDVNEQTENVRDSSSSSSVSQTYAKCWKARTFMSIIYLLTALTLSHFNCLVFLVRQCNKQIWRPEKSSRTDRDRMRMSIIQEGWHNISQCLRLFWSVGKNKETTWLPIATTWRDS